MRMKMIEHDPAGRGQRNSGLTQVMHNYATNHATLLAKGARGIPNG